MYNSVIAAVSTPPGKGGVAVIRMSGEGSFDIADKAFRPASGKQLSKCTPRRQIYGDVVSGGEKLDDGLACLFVAPNSYTGEDTVEFSIHGGILVTRRVLETLFALGARPAEAGEFTKRAFICGKLSLSDAEAIGMLLDAKSDEQLRLSGSDSMDRLTEALEGIRLSLVDLLSSMYARIDYPDEDLGDFTDSECIDRLRGVRLELERLMSTYRTGKAINEGISTVICGKPNVGKSSIYNMIFGEERAIVTDVEGTTRDVLCGQIPLGRVMLNLSDTAGIRSGSDADAVEKIGIERAKTLIRGCELLICVFDNSRPFSREDEEIVELSHAAGCTAVALINKCDMPRAVDADRIAREFDTVIEMSVKDGECDALARLTDAVDRLFTDEKISAGTDAIVATARQNAKLTAAHSLISSALEALEVGVAQDAASSDVELALGAISEIDGRGVSDEVVSDIFSKFCVGK